MKMMVWWGFLSLLLAPLGARANEECADVVRGYHSAFKDKKRQFFVPKLRLLARSSGGARCAAALAGIEQKEGQPKLAHYWGLQALKNQVRPEGMMGEFLFIKTVTAVTVSPQTGALGMKKPLRQQGLALLHAGVDSALPSGVYTIEGVNYQLDGNVEIGRNSLRWIVTGALVAGGLGVAGYGLHTTNQAREEVASSVDAANAANTARDERAYNRAVRAIDKGASKFNRGNTMILAGSGAALAGGALGYFWWDIFTPVVYIDGKPAPGLRAGGRF